MAPKIDLMALVLLSPVLKSIPCMLTAHWGAGAKSKAEDLNFCFLVEWGDLMFEKLLTGVEGNWTWHAALLKPPVNISFSSSEQILTWQRSPMLLGFLWLFFLVGLYLVESWELFPSPGLIGISVCLSGHVLMSKLRLVSEVDSTQS